MGDVALWQPEGCGLRRSCGGSRLLWGKRAWTRLWGSNGLQPPFYSATMIILMNSEPQPSSALYVN